MRIISGQLGGRQFRSPHGHRTHPMGDKMRGALFSVLGDVSGLTVLDAFAGTGALAFEALSRGATSALLVENDTNAQRTIGENISSLDVADRARLIRANVSSWSDNNPTQRFDLVLCDPPYGKLQDSVLQNLTHHLASAGTFIVSWPGSLAPPQFEGLHLVVSKTYGDAQLAFYQKTG